MRDDDAGGVAQHPPQRRLDERLGVHVERGQGVVEDQDARPREHRAGEREPLPLAAGQRHALLADAGVEAPRQVVHEPGLRDLERLVDVLVGGVGPAEQRGSPARSSRTASAPRTRSRRSAAGCPARSSRTSTPSTVMRPAVTSYSRGTSEVSTVLPEPVAPTTATRLAGRDLEVDVVQHEPRRAGRGTRSRRPRSAGGRAAARARRGPDDDRRRGVEDLQDPGGGGHRLLGHREDVAQGRDRPHQRQHQRDERDQRAEGELARGPRRARRAAARRRRRGSGSPRGRSRTATDSRTLSIEVS